MIDSSGSWARYVFLTFVCILSLTMVGSSISKDKEHLVREHVATRMSQGTLYHSSGQVTTLDPE